MVFQQTPKWPAATPVSGQLKNQSGYTYKMNIKLFIHGMHETSLTICPCYDNTDGALLALSDVNFYGLQVP